MKIEILKAVWIKGELKKVGDVFDCDQNLAAELISNNRAKKSIEAKVEKSVEIKAEKEIKKSKK